MSNQSEPIQHRVEAKTDAGWAPVFFCWDAELAKVALKACLDDEPTMEFRLQTVVHSSVITELDIHKFLANPFPEVSPIQEG